jgi:hypothetical protein
VYIKPGPSHDQQEAAVVDHCRSHEYQGVGVAHDPDAAASLIQSGLAGLVVAAFDPRDGLRHKVRLAGGEVEFVRQPRQPTTVALLFQRLKRSGTTESEIAAMHEMNTTDVRQILLRALRGKPSPRRGRGN